MASIAGALAAAVPASLASQPGDTLLTKLNESGPLIEAAAGGATAFNDGEKRSRISTCMAEMVELAVKLGPAGLFVGWNERLWHVGTIVVVQLLINDAVKHAFGL
eukprot:scaffold399623_cov34-Prasinocladus_malaysianus.AAC.1